MVRGWARVYRERVSAMLHAMVVCGDREQAEEWMVAFEGAFVSTPESWTDAFQSMVHKDSAEDVRRSELVHDRTDERELLYLYALRAQGAETQRAIKALEAKRRAKGLRI